MSASGVASAARTVSFYCHACSARFSLPAPSSPFHFTLCPRCRRDYLEDSPAPPHQAPLPVLPPPPPPPCAVPRPSRSIVSSAAESAPASQDLLPPPLPPWLLHDPCNYLYGPSDSPPPPIPHVSSSISAPTRPPRTLVSQSQCTRPSSSISSARLPPPPPCTWDYFFGPSDPVVATGKEGPPTNMSVRQVRREFRPSPAVSRQSSAYSSACSSPLLPSPPLHQQHQGELQPEPSPLSLSPTSQVLLPPPPPPQPWASPLSAWDDEYIFSPPDFDYESPPRPQPPPRPLPVSAYHATFETPLQLHGSRAPPPPVDSAHDAAVFDFDTAPSQRGGGGSRAAPAESIAALPTVDVTDAALVCAVCTDPLLASAPARRLPCGHLYHSHCIVTWLSLRNSCPVCRGSIPMLQPTAAADTASPPSIQPTTPGRRRSLPGGRRIRRICSRLLGRDRHTNTSRDRQTDSTGDVHV